MKNLIEAFQNNLAKKHTQTFNLIDKNLQIQKSITNYELAAAIHSLNEYCLDRKYQAGDLAIICCIDSFEIIKAITCCLSNGIIAAPCYPPFDRATLLKLIHVTKEINPKLIFIDQKTKKLFDLLKLKNSIFTKHVVKALVDKTIDNELLKNINFLHIPYCITENISANKKFSSFITENNDQAIAFLQYTSGSTADPNGVILTHKNLITNIKAMTDMMKLTPTSKIFSWLPLYHDMGLIGNMLTAITIGCDFYIMSPADFIKNPLNWLKAIDQFKITHSGGPNFAYELCLNKISTLKSKLNLSSWQVAYNGSEPIRFETLENFTIQFYSHGFNPKAFMPCYGLAETTLLATVNNNSEKFTLTVSKESFKKNIIKLAQAEQDSYQIVNCGKPFSDEKIIIVDPNKNILLSDLQIGEIWLSSPAVANGYWKKSAFTAEKFQVRLTDYADNFLRTGDLGFLYKGNLYITGRIKDLIIRYGKNYYPQDIEKLAENSHPTIRKGCVSAIGYHLNNEDKVALILEIKKGVKNTLYEQIIQQVRNYITAFEGIIIDDIVLVAPQTINKTTSGKLQRQKIKELYLNNKIKRLNK